MPSYYNGLSSSAAHENLEKYGHNTIPQKHMPLVLKLIRKLISPIQGMLLTAAFLSAYIGKMFDCYFILFLLIMNIVITLWQEHKADSSIAKLNAHLEETVSVMRDNEWRKISTNDIVVEDVVRLSIGEIIPADGLVLESSNASINESAMTGESLPVSKKEGDALYSGTFLTSGMLIMRIAATGKNTSLGKTLYAVDRIRKKSMLEKDILRISLYLSALSICAVFILTLVFWLQHAPLAELLTLDLSLLIAGVPISLPTVMTLIIEYGVLNLAAKDIIVRRLSALEDLANVNLLLTDKTGTLTTNTITISESITFGKTTEKQLLEYAVANVSHHEPDPIDKAIITRAKELGAVFKESDVVKFIPADSVRKHSSAIVRHGTEMYSIAVGAPQRILSMCTLDGQTEERAEAAVKRLARGGFRAIAVAVNRHSHEENNMELVGIMALSDKLREDAKDTIAFLEKHGISTVMVTGDHEAIASEIARQLSLDDGRVITKKQLDSINPEHSAYDLFKNTGAFAEILPEDKYKLVSIAKHYYVVAANGDGVNDLPAIKAANVGIAVKSAVSSLKATADIVLESGGIAVIKEAIIESRRIFSRIYSYSVYRMSESMRLIVTITVLGIIYRVYPLTPLQLILIALLNDIPIITLATDHVKTSRNPSSFDVAQRILLSVTYGSVGVLNSLLMFFLATYYLHLSWSVIQTLFFLKLAVSGHLLIYVAHTRERWYRFLPSKQIIIATTVTQLIATALVLTGLFMPARASIPLVILVWVWALAWMQISELLKKHI